MGAKSLFCCGDFTPFPRKRKTFISCGNAIFFGLTTESTEFFEAATGTTSPLCYACGTSWEEGALFFLGKGTTSFIRFLLAFS